MTRIARKRRSAPAAKLITATASYGPSVKAPSATPAARAAQADFARQADGVNTARIIRNADGGITAESGFGNGAKKYSDEQIKWVMSRGASGGSLSRQDQAVYDRMMWMRANDAAKAQEQKDLDAAHAEDERRRRLDAEEWDRQNAVRQEQQQAAAKQAQEAQIAEEQRRNAEYDRRAKAEQDYKAQQKQAALDAENAKYEALNRKYGIAEGTRLSEKDYNDLEAGRSKWGYSRTDQQAIDKINNGMDEARRSGDFTAAELATAEEDAKAKIAGFQKRLLPNDQPLTAEQIYNGSIAAPDGTRLISNGSGALIAIPGTGPQKEVETPAEKNARVAQERKDKWLDAQIASIMKEGTGKDSDGNTIPVSYQDAYNQAMEQMKIRFGEQTGSGLQLLVPGNLSHEGRPWKFYTDDSGKIAGYGTTRSTYTKTDDGNFAVIPTIVNGEELSLNDAVSHYKNTGEHWGVVRSESEAKMLAEQIHQKEQSLNQKAWNDYIHNNWDKISPSITRDKGVLDEHNRRTSSEHSTDWRKKLGW